MTGWGGKGGGSAAGGGGVPNVPGNTSSPDPAFSIYSEALSVPSGVDTDIISWIVPAGVTHLMRVEYGGCNIGDFRLFFGATIKARDFTWFNGPGLKGVWNFETMAGGGVPVAPATVVKVKVIHTRPQVGDYFARIQYLEIN